MTTDGLVKLQAWQKSREFANTIYREIIPLLPATEKFNLVSQLRRAATSIPANIAEGYGRFYYQTNIQFCYIARGSAEEVLSHLIIAHDQEFLTDSLFVKISEQGNTLIQLINGYIAYLKKSKHGENEPGCPKSINDDLGIYEIEGTTIFKDLNDSRVSNLDSRP